MKRAVIPASIQSEVLRNSRRRCALCYAYDFNTGVQKGQIAHIDHKPNNNKIDNLIFLCLKHHDEYDSTTSQSKNIKLEEVIEARKELSTFIEKSLANLTPETQIHKYKSAPKNGHTVSIEIYQARMPIYQAYRKFYSKIIQEATVDLPDLFAFANETHEALFLFGEEIANHLNEIYQKGVELRSNNKKMENPNKYTETEWQQIVIENSELIMWFANGFSKTRLKFLKYLRLK